MTAQLTGIGIYFEVILQWFILSQDSSKAWYLSWQSHIHKATGLKPITALCRATEQDTNWSLTWSHITSHSCKVFRLGYKWITKSPIQREKCSPLLLAAWEQCQISIGATQTVPAQIAFSLWSWLQYTCWSWRMELHVYVCEYVFMCVCGCVFQAFDLSIRLSPKCISAKWLSGLKTEHTSP